MCRPTDLSMCTKSPATSFLVHYQCCICSEQIHICMLICSLQIVFFFFRALRVELSSSFDEQTVGRERGKQAFRKVFCSQAISHEDTPTQRFVFSVQKLLVISPDQRSTINIVLEPLSFSFSLSLSPRESSTKAAFNVELLNFGECSLAGCGHVSCINDPNSTKTNKAFRQNGN